MFKSVASLRLVTKMLASLDDLFPSLAGSLGKERRASRLRKTSVIAGNGIPVTAALRGQFAESLYERRELHCRKVGHTEHSRTSS
jgi:hypothetical protein